MEAGNFKEITTKGNRTRGCIFFIANFYFGSKRIVCYGRVPEFSMSIYPYLMLAGK